MWFKVLVIVAGLFITVRAMMEGDRWDNIKVQIVSLVGFGMFWFGIGLLF